MSDTGGGSALSKPFLCVCGESDWRAYYDVPANQGVELFVGADGSIEEGDYHGDESIDGDPGENLMYICHACGHEIDLAAEEESPEEE
jgi:hypothetical protein